MPGPAPAKVQHMAIRLVRQAKREIPPVWDEGERSWHFDIEEEIVCSDDLHEFLDDTNDTTTDPDCDSGHTVTVRLAYRRIRQRWRIKCTVSADGGPETVLPLSYVMSLLAKPTNPHGDGKVASAADGSNKQSMNVKKTTVIRV